MRSVCSWLARGQQRSIFCSVCIFSALPCGSRLANGLALSTIIGPCLYLCARIHTSARSLAFRQTSNRQSGMLRITFFQ